MKNNYINALSKQICTIVALLICLRGSAQVTNEPKASLANYHSNQVVEKLFVHINKDLFVTGEIVWFKLYCVDRAANKPMDMSKVAYLELIDGKNTPVLQTKVALNKARGDGSIYLPSTIASGIYTLRAYTNWMKNFGTDSFFEQTITIINLLNPPVTVQKIADNYDVQFMPEGGNLVQNLTSKVAVKVTGSDGYGAAAYKGAIIDRKNDTVARFSPLKFGIGSFSFTPLDGQLYRAVIEVKGKTINKVLPNISQNGYVIHAEKKDSLWNISISKTRAASENGLYMVVHNSSGVISATELNSLSNYKLNKKQLKDGINIITLFNSQRQPVCERLIFKRPETSLQISANTDATVYEQRQKVTITIKSVAYNKPLNNTDLSLSVYKTDSLQKTDPVNIESYLWLSSEIKGDIESPGYYLESAAEVDLALDNLLLAQGWRAFNLTAASTNYKFNYLPEYAGSIVAATIINKNTGLPAKNVTSYLSIPDTSADRLFTAVSDATGKLRFNIGYAYGNHEIVLQANHFTDTTLYRFDLVNPFSTQYSVPKLHTVPSISTDKLDSYGLSMQVQNAYHSNNTRLFLAPYIDTLSFYGTPVKSFPLDNFTRFTTMEEVLQEFVTYIVPVRRNGKLYVNMYGQDRTFKDNPLILVDGVPLFDNNKIFSIDPLKINTINVFNKVYFQGPAKYEGLLALSSKKGDLGGVELDPKAIIIDYKGLQEQRQFYSPRYDTPAQRTSRVPDYRNALYWNPYITSDENGVTTISCYTSDVPGRYYGVLQGIINNGVAGSAYFTFDVK